jgi:hypothetical protein
MFMMVDYWVDIFLYLGCLPLTSQPLLLLVAAASQQAATSKPRWPNGLPQRPSCGASLWRRKVTAVAAPIRYAGPRWS